MEVPHSSMELCTLMLAKWYGHGLLLHHSNFFSKYIKLAFCITSNVNNLQTTANELMSIQIYICQAHTELKMMSLITLCNLFSKVPIVPTLCISKKLTHSLFCLCRIS